MDSTQKELDHGCYWMHTEERGQKRKRCGSVKDAKKQKSIEMYHECLVPASLETA